MKKKYLFILGMILLIGSIYALTQIDDTYLDTNLVGYWRLDNNNLSDSISNLTTINTGSTNGTGILVSGRDFDGTNDLINVSDSVVLNLSNGALSVNFWVNLTNGQVGAGNGFITKANVDGWGLLFNGDEFIALAYGGAEVVAGTKLLNTGRWIMITWTRNSTGFNRLYVNGTQDATVQNAADINSTANLIFGKWYPTAYLNGDLDEIGIWKGKELNTTEISDLYNSGNALPYTTTGTISTTLNSPANNSQTTVSQNTFNATITPATVNITNGTIYVWYSNQTIFNVTTSSLTGNMFNTTTWIINLSSTGNYLWNVKGCQNDGTCAFASNNFTLRYNIVTTNAMSFNVSSYETANETFIVNITSNGTTPISAKLIYGSIIDSATITNTNGNNYNISATIDVPLGVTNNSFYFNFSINGQEGTSDMFGQNISSTFFTYCNVTYSNDFLNITFKDEVTDAYINGSIPSSTFYYWLGSGDIFKSYTYSNSTNAHSWTFCASPTDRTFKVNESISYKQGTAYPQRTFTQSTAQSYTSSVTELPLYLLDSSSGLYVTFQVVNTAEQVLSNVISNITRLGNLIAGGVTGSDGGITYWLNPDHTYTASFLKNPFPLLTATQQFTQNSYTIVLGSTTSTNTSDYQAGISYTIQPTITYLNNDTVYLFNFSITSTYWSLERYGFNITNGSGVFIGSAVGSTSGGSLVSLSVNTSSNQSLIMNYYWTINSTNTTASRNWLVIDTSQNTFSIKRLVDDFVSYVGTGLFGLDNFGIGIICFIIIIGTTGVLKVKTGISNTATILGVMWSLVALLDVTFGLIPNPVGAISNFPTIFMGLIFMGVMFKEVFT